MVAQHQASWMGTQMLGKGAVDILPGRINLSLLARDRYIYMYVFPPFLFLTQHSEESYM